MVSRKCRHRVVQAAQPPPKLTHVRAVGAVGATKATPSTTPTQGTRILRQQSAATTHGLHSDAAVAFSRTQCIISACAYIWLLLSFARTDFAIRDLDAFGTVEPDVFINFGPYAYAVNTFTRTKSSNADIITSAEPVNVWSYKLDTTSIAMRAFGEFLHVAAFPPCVMYHGACATARDGGSTLTPTAGFTMLDALVDAVRANTSAAITDTAEHVVATSQPTGSPTATAARRSRQPQTLLLRVSYMFFDRIHHYLVPRLFLMPARRTCHAMYYSAALLEAAAAAAATQPPQFEQRLRNNNISSAVVDLCSHAYNGARPLFCTDLWTHFERSCHRRDLECRAVDRVSLHATQRLAALKAAHPTARVDLLVIESANDLTSHRGGLAFVAQRGADVVMLARVRDCRIDNANKVEHCATRIIDEHRYEGEAYATDILAWRTLATMLRSAAQSYYWLRLAMLLYGCYLTALHSISTNDTNSVAHARCTRLALARRALVIFFKIPSQVVVYGSWFPLTSYMLAHAVDANMAYDLIGATFDSFNGLLHLSLLKLVAISSVQMRNVWLLGGVAHAIVLVVTSRTTWSPTDGVWSAPQCSIALISSLTIVSQFRLVSLRRTPVVGSYQPIRSSVRAHVHPTIDAIASVSSGSGRGELGGLFMDLKAMMCCVVALAMFALLVTLLFQCTCPKATTRLTLVWWRAHSVTPLSASVLWPTNALAVSWSDDIIFISHVKSAFVLHQLRRLSRAVVRPNTVSDCTLEKPQQLPPALPSLRPTTQRKQLRSTAVDRSTLDDRTDVTEATMLLMNIAMLSDPVTFVMWRFGPTSLTQLGYYRSTATQRVYLVPLQYVNNRSGLDWRDFELERTVRVGELMWCELIRCG